MGTSNTRGNTHAQGDAKQMRAKAGTRSGKSKDQTNMQAGSGGRGGHRRRRGGPPQG
jgi:hypothetical protein